MAARFRWFIPLALAATWVSSQQVAPADRQSIPVLGTVTAISGTRITVESGSRRITVATDAATEVWKGTISHRISAVEIGDDFSARCRRDASGELVAEAIWLNIVNYFGVITKVERTADAFGMLTNPNADPQSAYKKKKLKVRVDAGTVFEGSAKDDLRSGREVQMIGLDRKDGTIQATHLVVYENKRPVRMGPGKVVPVTGQEK